MRNALLQPPKPFLVTTIPDVLLRISVSNTNSGCFNIILIIYFQVCSAGSRLIVQETVAQQMILKLKERMSHLRLGDPLDKCIDMGALVDQNQLNSVSKCVEEAIADGAEVLVP